MQPTNLAADSRIGYLILQLFSEFLSRCSLAGQHRWCDDLGGTRILTRAGGQGCGGIDHNRLHRVHAGWRYGILMMYASTGFGCGLRLAALR